MRKHERTKFKNAVYIIITLLSSIFLIVSYNSALTKENFYSDLLISLGTNLLSVCLLFFLVNKYFGLDSDESLLEKIEILLKQSEEPISVQKLFTTVSENKPPFNEFVSDARKLDILVLTAVNLLSLHQNTFISLGKQNCKIRLLCLNPMSEAARHVYGGKPDIYKANIESASYAIENLKKNIPTNFEIRLLNFAPTLSLIIVSKNQQQGKKKREQLNESMQVQLYLTKSAIGSDRPIFRLTSDDKWFGVFKKEFDELWNDSITWTSLNKK